MTIKPILKYPGSKQILAPWIIDHFPPHGTYVEPYMGSCAVFLNKRASEHEVLNDLSSSVVNLFRVLRERGPELADLVSFTPWAREEYNASYELSGDSLEDARRFLVRCWQAHGSRLNGKAGWRNRGPAAGGSTTLLWNKLPDRILAVVDRLKDAEIECLPALDIIARYNAPDVLLYLDPPYHLDTRHGAVYAHEMAENDHVRLLEAIARHAGMIVLSGYAHPLYEAYLADWQRVTVSALAEHGKAQTEVLWINPRAAGNRQLSLFGEDVSR